MEGNDVQVLVVALGCCSTKGLHLFLGQDGSEALEDVRVVLLPDATPLGFDVGDFPLDDGGRCLGLKDDDVRLAHCACACAVGSDMGDEAGPASSKNSGGWGGGRACTRQRSTRYFI